MGGGGKILKILWTYLMNGYSIFLLPSPKMISIKISIYYVYLIM